MAIVANVLPLDHFNVGDRVLWFDPTADVAGMKYGTVKAVDVTGTGTSKPIKLDVTLESDGVTVLSAQDAFLFRVVGRGIPTIRTF